MLYDVPRNFIGDTHWQESDAVVDGDEITFEKAGVLVQVAEKIATTEADLSGLWEHRKEKEKRANAQASSAKAASAGTRSSGVWRQGTLVPRNPNAPPKTPTPITARAKLPTRSLYEERQSELARSAARQNQQTHEEERPSKRPRNDENHVPLWQLLRSSRPIESRPAQLESPDTHARGGPRRNSDKTQRKNVFANSGRRKLSANKGQGTLRVADFVDLTATGSQGGTFDEDEAQAHLQSNTYTGTSRDLNVKRELIPDRLRGPGWVSPPKETSARKPREPCTHRETAPVPSTHLDGVEQETPLSKQRLEQSRRQADRATNAAQGMQKPRANSTRRLQQISLPNPSTPAIASLRTRRASPPVSTRNRLSTLHEQASGGQPIMTHGEEHTESLTTSRHESAPSKGTVATVPIQKEQDSKPLRVVTRPKRKMLSCLDALPAAQSNAIPKRTETSGADNTCDITHEQPAGPISKRPNSGEALIIPIGSSPAFETQPEQTKHAEARRCALLELDKDAGGKLHGAKRSPTVTARLPPHARLDAELLGVHQSKSANETTSDRGNNAYTLAPMEAGPEQNETSITDLSTAASKPPKPRAKKVVKAKKPKTTADAHDTTTNDAVQVHGRLQDQMTNGQSTTRPAKRADECVEQADRKGNPARRTRSPLKKAASIANGQGAAAEVGDSVNVTVLRDSRQGNKGVPSEPINPQPESIRMQALKRSASAIGPADPQFNKRSSKSKPVAPVDKVQPPPEPETERGPWTCEAFDLFGEEVVRAKEQKTGKTVDWLDRYTAQAAAGQADKSGFSSTAQMDVSCSFKTAAQMIAVAS